VIAEDDRVPSTGGDPYATWDAAYVLGALSKTERHEFEGHLRSCPTCDRAVGELAGMPALLGRLDADDISSIEESGQITGEASAPPAEILTSLMATVRRRRRARVLAWTGGVAAAAAVAIGVLVVVRPPALAPVAPVPPPRAAAQLAMTPVEPSPLTATVSLVSHSWGTGIEMDCTYGAEPEGADDGDVDKLAMVAVGRDGTRTQLATWVAHTGVVASPAGSTSMPINQIAAIQVVSAETGDVLLQRDS
jgi:putative zinc finger protein